MRRREFITLVGGLAIAGSGPRFAAAQEMPVIGFMRNSPASTSQRLMAGFYAGLREMRFTEGENLKIEYRWAEKSDDQLPAMASDLVRRRVALIATGGGITTALAAKRATDTIPIVFEAGGDPVKFGLVASLNRPGGNITGIALFSNTIGPKRLEFLKSLTAAPARVGVLVNPTNANTTHEVQLLHAAAASLQAELSILNAASAEQIDTAFEQMRHRGIRGLVVLANPLFVANTRRIASLAVREAIPAIYPFRDFAEAGGLMSYGDNLVDAFRQLGVYSGRILRGEKPAELPVVQPTKFELVLNLKTARSLGLKFPPTLLAIADEVIE